MQWTIMFMNYPSLTWNDLTLPANFYYALICDRYRTILFMERGKLVNPTVTIFTSSHQRTVFINKMSYLFNKPGYHTTKEYSIIAFNILAWNSNLGFLKKVLLVKMKIARHWANIKENNLWVSINQPSSWVNLKKKSNTVQEISSTLVSCNVHLKM